MARAVDDEHSRPEGVDDDTVEAVAKVSEALEYVERARGRIYDLHQLIGRADLLLGEAADQLEAAGHEEHAEMLRAETIGRNVLEGRWTFQIVEEFDAHYYSEVVAAEERVRNELMAGRRHVYEAEMKQDRRTAGRGGHEARPND